MHEFIASYGYYGMFFMGFVAATIIPLGSEWLLIVLLVKGLDPYILVFTAATGNYLGGATNYLIGYSGAKFLKIKEQNRAKAETIYNKYGAYSLLFSWLPVIGDPLCVVSGILKYSFVKFTFLVFTGKAARYSLLTYFTLSAVAQ
ncbi:MAG: hypothetical protein C0602_13525 [Denitrovibrio sp.]|nr:MAG: hypothetical protein C0602_13525 [Denitrovibrio sp.]